MIPQANITATGGTDFYRQVAIFAYATYLNQGKGTVIVPQDAFSTDENATIKACLRYISLAISPEYVPEKVIDQIKLYDPEKECVLTMLDAKGEAACITLREGFHVPFYRFSAAFDAEKTSS